MTIISKHSVAGAVNAPSPNFSGEITPRFVVMHYTASWNVDSVIATFGNPASQVSAHVTIDTDGKVYQHVPLNRRAWHAGPSAFGGYSGLNSHSIGIELVNPGFLRKLDDGSFQDSHGNIRSAAQVGPVVASKNPKVGSGMFYWPVYTEAQLSATEDLVEELLKCYPIIDIVSHEEIDKRGWKTDPGPAFPMNRFRGLLRDRGNDVVEYEVTVKSLNLRGGPGTQFAVLGSLARGKKVTAIDIRGDWVRVSAEAWAHGGYLRRTT